MFNINSKGFRIAAGLIAFVASTWISAYFSIQSANAQSFGFGTVTSSTQYWYKVGNTGPDIYYKDGKVGIGTPVAAGALDLGNGTAGRSIVWGGSNGGEAWYASIGTSYSSADLNILSGLKLDPASDVYKYSFTDTTSPYYAASGIELDMSGSNSQISFFTENAASHTAGDAGPVLVNGTTVQMWVDPSGTHSTSFLYSSDARLKTDIQPLAGALEKIEKIGGYSFKWKDGRDDNLHLGVLAQEVEKQFPEAVKTSSDGYKAVDYPALVPVLFEAIKEQQKQINELKEKLAQ